MKKRFVMERKLVACVRFYETMYLITDGEGVRVFTGTDEKIAKQILRTLNAYPLRRATARRVGRKRKRR